MEQEIQYCSAFDGARIAFATTGNGPPLVRAANYLTHLEYDWESPVWRHWLEALSAHHTLVRYDERGSGLSDWEADDLSFEAWVNDLETVVDALGLERFPLLGVSQGGPVAIAYAHRHPEKVSKLILYGTYLLGRFNRDPSPDQLAEAEAMLRTIEVGWGMNNPAFRQVFSTLYMPQGETDQVTWYNELERISSTPQNAAKLERHMYGIDVTEFASKLDVPTLVLHLRDDAMVPYEQGQLLSATIPNAHFIPLEGKNHILLESDLSWPRFVTELYRFLGLDENKIAAFIDSRENGTLRDYQSVAILFADMAHFTPLSTLLDPAELVKLLDVTFSQFDTILEKYGVQKLRITGDEYMAAAGLARPQPDHAQKLVAAALDMLAYINSLPEQKGQPISFRFGINIGPVTAGMVGRLDPHYGLWGDAVNIASRMESTGVPGKIQITRMAYEQLKDDFICESRGEIQVKGKGPMETWFLVGQRA